MSAFQRTCKSCGVIKTRSLEEWSNDTLPFYCLQCKAIREGGNPVKMSSREQLLQVHALLCQKARDLMAKKNTDYSSDKSPFANFERSQHMGVCSVEQAILSRMIDKFSRLSTFAEKGNLLNESVEDSILDIINYAVLFQAYLNSKDPKKLSAQVYDPLESILRIETLKKEIEIEKKKNKDSRELADRDSIYKEGGNQGAELAAGPRRGVASLDASGSTFGPLHEVPVKGVEDSAGGLLGGHPLPRAPMADEGPF